MFFCKSPKLKTTFLFVVFFVSFYFSLTQKTYAAFSCTSGSLDTTCYVSTTTTATNGETVTGTGNIEIQSGGNITLAAGSSFNINISGDLTIQSGGTITGNINATATDITIDSGGSINVSGKGYQSSGTNCTTGGGFGGGACYNNGTYFAASGGSYGGSSGYARYSTLGYSVSSVAYGSITQPSDFGSAGGGNTTYPGGAGGGIVRLVASGQLSINGIISSNGGNGGGTSSRASGGGSGGTIYLSSSVLSGSGTVTANGGNGYVYTATHAGGGGSGGRIIINYSTNNSSINATSYGGTGYQMGSYGTIIYKASSHINSGQLIIDSGGTTTATYENAPVPDNFSSYTFDDVIVRNYSFVNGTLNTIDLSVENGATLSHHSNTTSKIYYLDIEASGDVTITGNIDVSGKGYSGGAGATCWVGSGDGGGSCLIPNRVSGGGGAYGGYGGMGKYDTLGTANGGSPYGSVTEPVSLGSAGGGRSTYPGGSGGGSIKIISGGVFNLAGSILSEGSDAVSGDSNTPGGGSGGSVWIQASSFSGSGLISANGGDGATSGNFYGGGGSGGRISIRHDMSDDVLYNLTSYGGSSGYQMGANGTVLVKKSNHSNSGQLLVNSGGTSSAHINIANPNNLSSYIFDDVTISNFSILNGIINTGSLNILSGSTLSHPSNTSLKSNYLDINATGNVSIIGDININNKGFSGGSGANCFVGYGTGAGNCFPNGTYGVGSGAGYGGSGGTGRYSTLGTAVGGVSYGSVIEPTDLGSSGGGKSTTYPGGAGGGIIKLISSGNVLISGNISVDGQSPSGTTGIAPGGGSGGSVWIRGVSIDGSGSISAKGGNGYVYQATHAGGGGSGGIIALYGGSVSDSLSYNVVGGTGYENGQSGAYNVYTLSVPSTPQSPNASASDRSVNISWSVPLSDGGSVITGYNIYNYSTNALIVSVSSTTFSYEDSNLSNGQSYSYYVTAFNMLGESASSSVVTATPSTIPSAPIDILGTSANQSARIDFTPSSNGGSEILYYYASSTPGDFTSVSTSTTIWITGLTNGVSYTFSVIAVNANGSSTPSLSSDIVIPADIPSSPIDLSGTAGNESVQLVWAVPTSNGGSEILSYYIINDHGVATTTIDAPATTTTITGLTNGTAYTFSIYAINSAGTSTSFVSDSITPMSVPGSPVIDSVSAGNTQATISFTAPENNGGSEILYYTILLDSGITMATTTESPVTITGLTSGSSYIFIMKATNIVGDSASSTPSDSVTIPRRSTGRRYPSQQIVTYTESSVVSSTQEMSTTSATSTPETQQINSSSTDSLIENNQNNKEESKNHNNTVTQVNNSPYLFLKNLKVGMSDIDVKYLQIYLNKNGYIVSTEGPGSPGNETEYFGTLTQKALSKYQKDNNIFPFSGFFGPLTRNYINKIYVQGFTINVDKPKYVFDKDLYFGLKDIDVRYLQIFLNNNGYIISTEGPGSPGNETEMFGYATQNALSRFQIDNQIIPAIGYFGPKTREIVNSK